MTFSSSRCSFKDLIFIPNTTSCFIGAMIWFSKQKEFVAFFREDLQSNFVFNFLVLSLNRFLILFFC